MLLTSMYIFEDKIDMLKVYYYNHNLAILMTNNFYPYTNTIKYKINGDVLNSNLDLHHFVNILLSRYSLS